MQFCIYITTNTEKLQEVISIEGKKLVRMIQNILLSINMKTTKGFLYWLRALEYNITHNQDCEIIADIHEIYSFLVKKYNTSYDNVEKSMRYAKNTVHKDKFNGKQMKNREFLIVLTRKVMLQIERWCRSK